MRDSEMVPFAMRFAAVQTVSQPEPVGVRYDQDLQISMTAAGNPWAHTPQGETSSNTNLDSNNDEGTDLY